MSGLADRLREARERAGLSMRALDEKAQITPGHTALIESGRRESPNVETARKLAAALGISLDWLITGEAASSPTLRDLAPDTESSPSLEDVDDDEPSVDPTKPSAA